MKRFGPWLVVLASALWGTDALFRRPLTDSLSPVTIVLLEHALLCVVMFPVLLKHRREFLSLNRQDCASLAFIALGGSVAATSLFTFAMKYGNPSAVILLQKTQPLFTVLLARLVLGERPARWFWTWFAAAMAGAYLLSGPDWRGSPIWSPSHPAVTLSALGAACLWGGATVCGRYMVSRISTPFLTGMRFLIALPALAILFALQPASQRVLPASASIAVNIAAMALLAGLAALFLYYKGLQSTSASLASVCELAFPVTAVILNWLLLHVALSGMQILGSGILVTSVTILAIRHARDLERREIAAPKPIDS